MSTRMLPRLRLKHWGAEPPRWLLSGCGDKSRRWWTEDFWIFVILFASEPTLYLLIFLFTLVPFACNSDGHLEVYFQRDAQILSPKLKVELALTEQERSQGLMYRREMPKDKGMLFIFPDEKERSFWMKNTYIPLDIIFLDKSLKIVSVGSDARPLSTERVNSNGPSAYVLELIAGQAKVFGLQKGDVLIADVSGVRAR